MSNNVIRKATNKWTKGLVMDFSPENTKNEVLTNALNATLLTFNGNELSLQNDMGNARVESAFLPEGYIPVGTCEYGGIIYIVSYNPLEDKSLIGCFPSPERNISREEMGRSDKISISYTDFQEIENRSLTGNLKNTTYKILLRDSNLNPGDKYIVYSNDSIYDERIQDMFKWDGTEFQLVENPLIKLNLVSIQDEGKIIYLDSDVRLYEVTKNNNKFSYHILGLILDSATNKPIDVDSYRNVLSSGYSVFKEKTSGKLALLAELITIDSFSLTYSIQAGSESEDKLYRDYHIVLHTEISPEITFKNYNTTPKLKYYYSDKLSLMLLIMKDNSLETVDLQNSTEDYYLSNVFNTNVEEIDNKLKGISLKDMNLPFDTRNYHQSTVTMILLEKDGFYVMPGKLISKFNKPWRVFTCITDETGNEKPDLSFHGNYSESGKLIVIPDESLIFYKLDLCVNNILAVRPINNPLFACELIEYELEYIPDLQTGKYDDIIYQTIKIPKILSDNKINLPFIYNYTITPCMEYGKLDYLSVSNTVNFNNLFDFEASKFNTWRYRIDGNQLMLTFGSEIYDTFSDKKVTGLVLEFYDWRGFAGSLEISNKKAYSGTFTKIISLNTLNAISTNKISGNEYITGPKRNINIYKNDEDGLYYLNGKIVKFVEENWKYQNKDKDDKLIYNDLQDSDNDCGTLYSNVIYGVKAYFKISENALDSFIEKETFFLFTFPIYNEYYYTVLNYNDIHDPKLKMFLTYTLKDSSTINTLVKPDEFIEGYNKDDFNKITSYLEGNDKNTLLEVTRYFHVSGETKLTLEVGLLKEYETYNLSCKKEINNGVMCNLQLSGNTSGSFDTNATNILEGASLQFNNEESSFELMTEIPIKYDFYIGYPIKIVNIRDSSIPMTTVCALYHKQGEYYNEADFGIRTNLNSKNLTEYLSDFVFYNSGSSVDYKFGVAKMLDIHGATMENQCVTYNSYEAAATDEKTPTRLNAGDSLKKMLPYMGKYTFCQPHTHYMFGGFKNNLNKLDTGEFYLSTKIFENNILKDNPLYNLSLNTVNSVMHLAEFISTSHGGNVNINDVPYKKYVGFTAPLVAKFNRCMLNTMKSVYAYNPDYDTILIRLGDVLVESLTLSFTSNIISTGLTLPNDLNSYIIIGGVSIADYLNDLNKQSSITIKNSNKWIPTLQFKPDYTYCGTEATHYLVSPLTYNIETPKLIYDDLTFDQSNKVAVRHHDNTYNFITGDINKNLLYGWGFNKLIQLDVTNYQISWDGSLILPLRNTYKEIEIQTKPDYSKSSLLSEVISLPPNSQHTLTLGTFSIDEDIVNINCLLRASAKTNIHVSKELDNPPVITVEFEQNTFPKSYDRTVEFETTPTFPSDQVDPTIPYLEITILLVKGDVCVKISEFSIIVGNTNLPIKILKEGKGTLQLFEVASPLHFPDTIKYIVYLPESYENDPNNIIHVIKTTGYGRYPDSHVYEVSYDKVCLVGSLITLNDLVYYPEKDGHRLFMRNNCFSEVFNEKNKIYYRGSKTDSIENKDKNSLYICYGPCFNGMGIDKEDPEYKEKV